MARVVKNITAKQAQAIALLVSGATYSLVAREVGVAHGTLSKWRKDPAFKAALDEHVTAILEESQRVAIGSLAEGNAVLREIMLDTSLPPQARVSAVRALHQHVASFLSRADTSETQTVVIVEDDAGG